MASKIQIRASKVTCVYDDRFRPLLEALGTLEISRASNVEYNPLSQEWEAETAKEAVLIAHGPNRNEVISQEVKWLEERL